MVGKSTMVARLLRAIFEVSWMNSHVIYHHQNWPLSSQLYSSPLHGKTNFGSFQHGIGWIQLPNLTMPNQCIYLRSSLVRLGLV